MLELARPTQEFLDEIADIAVEREPQVRADLAADGLHLTDDETSAVALSSVVDDLAQLRGAQIEVDDADVLFMSLSGFGVVAGEMQDANV